MKITAEEDKVIYVFKGLAIPMARLGKQCSFLREDSLGDFS